MENKQGDPRTPRHGTISRTNRHPRDCRPHEGNIQAMDELRLILKEREPYYSQADHVIDTAGRTLDEVFSELDAIAGPILTLR